MRSRKCNEIPQMPKRDGKRSQTPPLDADATVGGGIEILTRSPQPRRAAAQQLTRPSRHARHAHQACERGGARNGAMRHYGAPNEKPAARPQAARNGGQLSHRAEPQANEACLRSSELESRILVRNAPRTARNEERKPARRGGATRDNGAATAGAPNGGAVENK
jgi:hypothetical protein